MPECPLMDDCKFYEKYENTDNKTLLEGFVKRFCKGDFNKCVIKKITEDHSMDYVPGNMLPDGMPEPGTDDSDWSEDIIDYM